MIKLKKTNLVQGDVAAQSYYYKYVQIKVGHFL